MKNPELLALLGIPVAALAIGLFLSSKASGTEPSYMAIYNQCDPGDKQYAFCIGEDMQRIYYTLKDCVQGEDSVWRWMNTGVQPDDCITLL